MNLLIQLYNSLGWDIILYIYLALMSKWLKKRIYDGQHCEVVVEDAHDDEKGSMNF